ncbi:hypothetical protein SRHO_G00116990 [Serrasalmus rhombeus]
MGLCVSGSLYSCMQGSVCIGPIVGHRCLFYRHIIVSQNLSDSVMYSKFMSVYLLFTQSCIMLCLVYPCSYLIIFL